MITKRKGLKKLRAYADYLYSSAAIMNKKIEFYSSIAYTVLKSNQEPIRLKLQIGDIVELNEESEDYIDTVSECLLYDIQKPEELR
ncbi:3130_t:CDS:2 [Funneliformis geosporum]|nr:3130_t:CDS:2 [Funneliformis geosporum]